MENKSNEKKGKKVVKTIFSIASTGLAVVAVVVTMNKLGVFNKINPNPDPNPTPMREKLNTPENLLYDKETKLLTWDSVENADEYKVNINGDVQTVSEASFSYIPSEKTTTFKVQALDSTGNYLSSDWSSVYTYTMEDQKQDEEIDLAKVDYFVNSISKGYNLVYIASMYIDDTSKYIDDRGFYVQGKFKDSNKKNKVVNIHFLYNEPISTLSEAMNKEKDWTVIENEYDVAYYDSAQYLLDSHSYAGKMEEYRQAGYNFDVVSSCVGYESSDEFTIYGTYKLTRGNEVRYIQQEMWCGITDPSPSEETNYTTNLLYTNTRALEEKSCHELTGDLAKWAEKYDAKINASTNSTQNTIGNNAKIADR